MYNFIFDIGANRGNFTKAHLDLNPNLRSIMVEADPRVYKILVGMNSPNITVLNMAASDKDLDFVDFYTSNEPLVSTASTDWINKSRFFGKYRWTGPHKIPSITIDSMLELYGIPDFIKVDVEGYELQVLRGLTKRSSPLAFEWAEEEYDKINQTVSHLESIGYTEFGITYEDKYTEMPDEFSSWKDCKIHKDIDVSRKDKWGMIFAR